MEDLTLVNFSKQFPDEDACIDYLAKLRWGDSPICPRCGSVAAYTIPSRHIFKCPDCMKQFSVRTGTIFEESRLPLLKWFYAVYLLTSQKKGISSVRMAEYLGVTQKSAWFMLQRIRHALSYGFDAPLDGTIEIDETYVGGKARRDVIYKNKTAVIGAVERKKGGRITTLVTDANSTSSRDFIRKRVTETALIHTDESKIYHRVKRSHVHMVVNHSQGEYSRDGVHTNTIEGAWNHLKLGLKAIYMGVSPKHLAMYCDEFGFRYSTRELKDGERFAKFFSKVNGKRLTYENLIS